MNKQKIVIEILFFLVGLVALYFGVYKGAMLVLNAGKILGQEQDSLARWENRQSIVQVLNNKVKDLAFKDELHLAMPVNEKTGEFLKSVQGAAQSAGIAIKNFTPSNFNAESSATISETAAKDEIQPAKMALYSVDITVEGTYEKIYAFLNNLEKIKRVTQVSQVNIAKNSGDVLTANINIIVYYLQD